MDDGGLMITGRKYFIECILAISLIVLIAGTATGLVGEWHFDEDVKFCSACGDDKNSRS